MLAALRQRRDHRVDLVLLFAAGAQRIQQRIVEYHPPSPPVFPIARFRDLPAGEALRPAGRFGVGPTIVGYLAWNFALSRAPAMIPPPMSPALNLGRMSRRTITPVIRSVRTSSAP